MTIQLPDADAEIEPVPTSGGGHRPEPEIDRRLPVLSLALEQGDLSWSKLRELVPIATAGNEEEWLVTAMGVTAAELRTLVRAYAAQHRATVSLASVTEDATSQVDAEPHEDLIEGEPGVWVRIPCPRNVRRSWRTATELARRTAGENIPQWRVAEYLAAEALAAVDSPCSHPLTEVPCGEEIGATVARPRLSRLSLGASFDRDANVHVVSAVPRASSQPRAVVPEELEPLTVDLDCLDDHALDARMRAAVAFAQRADALIGVLLAAFVTARLHRACGYPTLESYVYERVGMCASKVRALVALARKGATSPVVWRAYARGELSWLRAMSLLPVLREENADTWLRRAGEVTLRRLRDEIEWALDRQDSRFAESLPTPPELGASLREPQVPSCTERQIGEHVVAGTSPLCAATSAALAVEVRFLAPVSVMNLLREALRAWCIPPERAWQAFERMIAHAIGQWSAVPRHRDPIFERDGWRCAVPGCNSRRNLHDHHIAFRSLGGDNARDNRITVCAWHHLRGLHMGVLRASGLVSDGIVWELGIGRGGIVLMRLHGDVYEDLAGGGSAYAIETAEPDRRPTVHAA